jgi:iron complex transport system substrate-binding protein
MASTTPAKHVITRQPGWNGLKAVRNGRIYDGFDNNVILRPGPRVMQAIEAIKKRIHE